MRAASSDLHTGAWLSALLLAVYLVSYSGIMHSIDEISALAVAESWLAGNKGTTNQMEWEQMWSPSQNAYGTDGSLYAKKGIGVSLVALPLFAAGKLWRTTGPLPLALLASPLLLAMTGYTLFLLTRRLDFSRRTAAIGVLAWGLGTMAWPYARTLFSEPLAALGVCLAMYGVLTFRRMPSDRTGAGPLTLGGIGLATLIAAKQANAVLVPIFCIYVAYAVIERGRSVDCRLRLLVRGAAYGLPILAGLVVILAYNTLRFGSPWLTPFDPGEGFRTPLWQGLAGLLVSPGKGLMWYVPLTWMAAIGMPRWRKARRLPDFLLALGVVISFLGLYGAWSDWAGGRAWGPRFLMAATPALAVLALPALDAMVTPGAAAWKRGLIAAILVLSVLVQLPGVLVDFNQQEEIEFRAGVTAEQRYWTWTHSPLHTYWGAIGSPTADPLWLQGFFRQRPVPLVAMTLAAGVGALTLAVWGVTRASHKRSSARALVAAAAAPILLGAGQVLAASGDPRWQEAGADPAANQQLFELIRRDASSRDVVLLDMIPYFDAGGRFELWMNFAPFPPEYIGWLRKNPLTAAQEGRLREWLRPYDRVWLSLEGTQPAAPGSTTENWLDSWAYRGREEWVGTQRLVEYLLPVSDGDTILAKAPQVFQGGPVLLGYTARRGRSPDQVLIRLRWNAPAPETLRFSLQALDRDGRLLRQVDRRPGATATGDGYEDRIGLAVGSTDYSLILRVYEAGSGRVLPVLGEDESPIGEQLDLAIEGR